MTTAWAKRSLLTRFGVLSFVVIATLGMVLVGSLRHGVIQRTLLDARRSAVTAAATGIQPLLTPADLTRDATPLSSQRLDWLNVAMASAISPQGIVGLKVWDLNHRIIYSDQPDLLGQLFAGPDLLGQTLNGQITSRVTDPTVVGQDPSPQPPMDQHIRMLEVSIPLAIPAGVDPAEATMFTPDGSGQVLGALQIYLPYQPIADRIMDQTRELVLVLGWGLLLLWALLFRLVSSASQRLTSQAEANRYLSERDPLTGLVNRSVFGMNLTKTMEEGSPIAVAVVDLKRFQDINDTLGHSTGDALLRQVSDRLQTRLHEGEQLSRMGGDEFGLLLPGVTTPTAARSRVLEVLATFDRPFQIGELSIESDATVGVTLSVGLEVPTAEEMIQQADIALYQARFDHARIGVFDPSRNHFTRDRLQLATQFRHALDHNQIEVVFQPQANLRTGKVHSLEALVRWRHPERGLLAPAEFIDLVEQTDLVRDLTARVLDLALYQVRCWRDGGMRLRVSVNISARDCTNPELPTVISQILQRYDLNTDVLTCELTESAMLTNPSAAREVLGRLAHMGIEVSIDDFGTGYASLAYVRSMPVSELKIDRSFVRGLHNRGPDADVVRFTTDLGRRLHLRVVAEGVESAADIAVLQGLGCQVVQGFQVSRPMDAATATAWLRAADTVAIGTRRLTLPAPQRRAEIARKLAAEQVLAELAISMPAWPDEPLVEGSVAV